jgi:peptide/nickel transport system substrate-binding protein
MKKLQVWGWLISGFLKKHKKIIFLGFALGIIFAIFIIWVLPYIPRPNPITQVGLIGQYSKNNLPKYVTSKIGQGLTSVLEDGSASPALAKEWSVDSENKTYTFFLRDDIYWQDKTLLKAEDLNYNFKDVETKVLDDKTIQFKLKEPFTPFPILLSKPALKNGTIGTGEYQIKKIKQKGPFLENILLESSKESILVKFYPSLSAAKTAFTLGEVSKIVELFQNPFENDQVWANTVNIDSGLDFDQYLGLFLNNEDPMLKDKAFRQSLAYATNKPADNSRCTGPINPNSWAYNDDLKTYEFNPQRALELLEKSIGNLSKAKEITLRLSTTPVFLTQAEEIKKTWEETLSIKVDIDVINTIPQNYQILLASQEIPPDPDQYSLWHSTQTQNFIKFKNPRIDKLLEDARKEKDTEIRLEQYLDFQRYFVEESPIIFLNHPKTYTLERKSVVQPLINKLLQFGKK